MWDERRRNRNQCVVIFLGVYPSTFTPRLQGDTSGEVDKSNTLWKLLAFQIIFWPGSLKSAPGPRMRVSLVLSGEWEGHGCWCSDDAGGLWRIGDLEPEIELTVNCIESTPATSVQYMRNRTSSQSRKTSSPLPERSQAWNQVTVAAGSGGMLGRDVEPRTWAEGVSDMTLLLQVCSKLPTL